MSPMNTVTYITDTSFPRVSGDEPLTMPHLLGLAKFSPRERG